MTQRSMGNAFPFGELEIPPPEVPVFVPTIPKQVSSREIYQNAGHSNRAFSYYFYTLHPNDFPLFFLKI